MTTRVVAAALLAAALLAGCAGPATFISTDPPPDATAEAWFASATPAVQDALRASMLSVGLSIDEPATTPTTVVGRKTCAPQADGSAPDAPHARIVVTAHLTRGADTHVRAVVSADAPPGGLPYEWDVPTDLLDSVLRGARDRLHERHARIALPPRFRPPKWVPPRRR